jgi:hypothetical protein
LFFLAIYGIIAKQKGGLFHAKGQFYFNRTPGRYCDNRNSFGVFVAGVKRGARAGETDKLREQFETDWPSDENVFV